MSDWSPVDFSTLEGEEIGGFRLGRHMPNASFGVLFSTEHGQLDGVMRIVRFGPDASVDETHLGEALALPEATHATGATVEPYLSIGIAKHGVFKGATYFIRRNIKTTLRRVLGSARAHKQADAALFDLVSGLVYLHEAKRIHGDVKPSNVALHNGRFVLVDYGLMPLWLDGPGRSVHRRRDDYRAPETRDGLLLPESDIYSAALTAIAAYSGIEDLSGAPVEHRIRDLYREQVLASDVADLLRAAVSPDPYARPSAAAILAYLTKDTNHLARFTWPAQFATRDFTDQLTRRLMASLPLEMHSGAKDFVQDAMLRVARRIQADPLTAVRLSGPSALFRYTLVSARHVATDYARKSTRIYLYSPEDMPELASANPADAVDEASDILERIAEEIGDRAMRMLLARMNGDDYPEIAATLAREWGERLNSGAVFMTLYRLRRAYPEVADVLPVDDADSAESYLFKWLGEYSNLDSGTREMIAAILAGLSIEAYARRAGRPAGTLRRELAEIGAADPWLRLLLSPSAPLPSKFTAGASAFAGAQLAPDVDNLADDWITHIKSSAAERLAGLTSGEGVSQKQADALVDDILSELRTVQSVQKWVLDQPMISTDKLADALGIAQIDADTMVREMRALNDLVVLNDGSRDVIPAFQFNGSFELKSAVARVNRILDAGADAWGVASWWRTENGRLPQSAAPARVIDDQPEIIIALAEAVGSQ